ncbi:MAG: MATE family multidrug exporter [Alphaproteobacteria bacterium ADurb.Bin438]|nr:MAG: MATE family multidrug exporter [Alphaproteobacteria bacterium ADurb.Bin438]
MIIISNVLVIKFGYGVKGIAYATVFCEFFELLYYLTLNKISFEKIDKTILNEILEIYKQCIAGVLSHRIGVIIFTSIASTLGEDLYSIHVMCCQIAFFINAFGLGIAEGLLVLFGMSISTFDEKIVKNNLKTLKKSSYIGTSLLIFIALLVSYPFLKFMADNKNMEIVLIYMGIFMFEILFECLSNPMEAMLNVAKEVRFVKMVNFLSVFFIRNITLIILLYILNFGIYGVAMALVFDYFIRTLVYYHKMNKNLNWINYN